MRPNSNNPTKAWSINKLEFGGINGKRKEPWFEKGIHETQACGKRDFPPFRIILLHVRAVGQNSEVGQRASCYGIAVCGVWLIGFVFSRSFHTRILGSPVELCLPYAV